MFASDKLFFFILISSLIICSLGQSDYYCPSSSELSPYCNCTSPSSATIIMDCSKVETEDQLKEIFTNANIPYNHMKELRIENNDQLKYLTNNVFGSVTFEIVTFSHDVIEYIDELVFSNSKTYLKEWHVYYCPAIASGFPFYSLNAFTVLTTLLFDYSGSMNVMPRIHSNSMTYLSFFNTEIGYLPITSFYDIPNLVNLTLNGNNFDSLPYGTFEKNKYLENVRISQNSLGQFSNGAIANLTKLLTLYLAENNLTFIEPGALHNLTKLDSIDLSRNELGYLTSANLGYLPSVQTIRVSRNNIQIYEKYIFNCCPKLTVFYAGFNKLTKVSNDDFRGSETLLELHINENEISTIEAGSFAVLMNGFLNLSRNLLTTLDEYWLRSVLENQNMVDISNNPLECGCDMAWLFNDQLLMTNLDATCENGTDIHDLDPFYFNTTCFIQVKWLPA